MRTQAVTVAMTNFLLCSLALPTVTLPTPISSILSHSTTIAQTPPSLIPAISDSPAASIHHEKRAEPMAPSRASKMAKAPSSIIAGQIITENGYTRRGIFVVKAMLYSVILVCIVEISVTFTRWLHGVPIPTSTTAAAALLSTRPCATELFLEEDGDDEANIPVL